MKITPLESKGLRIISKYPSGLWGLVSLGLSLCTNVHPMPSFDTMIMKARNVLDSLLEKGLIEKRPVSDVMKYFLTKAGKRCLNS